MAVRLKGTPPSALPRRVLVDANVFFAPRMRDLFMYLHEQGLIDIHWTTEIEDEWTRNVIVKHGAMPESIERCKQGMRDAVPGWEVADYGRYEADYPSVDAKDRHVAAAACKLADDYEEPVVLVTRNLRDFPASAFDGRSVARMAMGPFLARLHSETPDPFSKVIEICRTKLRAPPCSRSEYIDMLMQNDCKTLAKRMAVAWGLAHI
jgi:hypothetical protein